MPKFHGSMELKTCTNVNGNQSCNTMTKEYDDEEKARKDFEEQIKSFPRISDFMKQVESAILIPSLSRPPLMEEPIAVQDGDNLRAATEALNAEPSASGLEDATKAMASMQGGDSTKPYMRLKIAYEQLKRHLQ